MNIKRELQFILEEIVKIPDTEKSSLISDGMIDAIRITKGYCTTNNKGEIDSFVINSIDITNNIDMGQTGVSSIKSDECQSLIQRIIRRLRGDNYDK